MELVQDLNGVLRTGSRRRSRNPHGASRKNPPPSGRGEVSISRHREQLADPDMDAEESIARAVATAGSAVVFADATVIVALAALSATGIPCPAVMGLSAAATVLIAVLIAVSLVPAVLGLFG
ncbi:MMPL family transporter [Streptomyces sp. NPDC007896]|uniref:MMPL family transporter n=1 Tax=Streptomyces sp. NPDC007896 TaxID=3364784 RepID=UPI0036EF9B8E